MNNVLCTERSSAPTCDRRLLLASNRSDAKSLTLQQELSTDGCDVSTVGVGEALWMWPLAGYQLVVIDAKIQPELGIDLCRYIKHTSPAQRVALLLGDRTGMVPRRFDADAVLAGDPSTTQLVGILHLLLSAVTKTSATNSAADWR